MNNFNIYAFLTPIALSLLVMEVIYNHFWKKELMNFQDSITNMGTAIWNQCTNLLVAITVFRCFGWLHDKFALNNINSSILSFIVLLILFDFLFYWFHRLGHSINILWAAHMPHHSSEEFNLFVGLRASITQRLFSFIFMWPLVIIGFSPQDIYMASAVQLILAYWHHTKVIKKMGLFEVIFNSPSYHRVHHAINERYLDKNFGEIFIVWDKWFGTYQDEDEEVIFGSLNPVESWSPNKINFQFWSYLWQDAVHTKKWSDKFKLWFMPLGWRPEDCKNRPRKRITALNLVKFKTVMIPFYKPYLVAQMCLGLFLMYFVIDSKSPLTFNEKMIMSFSLWLMITSWGGILENRSWVKWFEPIQLILTMSLFSYFWSKYHQFSVNIILFSFMMLSIGWLAYINIYLSKKIPTSLVLEK